MSAIQAVMAVMGFKVVSDVDGTYLEHVADGVAHVISVQKKGAKSRLPSSWDEVVTLSQSLCYHVVQTQRLTMREAQAWLIDRIPAPE